MASYTLIARIHAGNGKFPFLNVPFSKNHRPIAIPGATYYVRPTSGNRTPIRIGKDLRTAYTALIKIEDREPVRTENSVQSENAELTTILLGD